MIFVGLEKVGFVLLFCSPDEFYVRFVTANEPIILSSVNKTDQKPAKNEILANSRFIIAYNSEYAICQIKEDLKYDEIFCQVSLCNTDIMLKVDYRKLIIIKPEDIVSNSVSLKFHDFSPCFPNQWNSNLILKLKKLMSYNTMIFQYKSFMVDPSDGRYPVEVFNLADRKSLNERFINDNLATKSSENFKAKLENTFTEVFNEKKTKDVFYQVSVPLVKSKPKPRANNSSVKALNARAQIFIPNKENELNQSVNKPTVKSNAPPLSFNIVNMFSEMYRSRQNNKKVPFTNYQSVFPLYGGVDFSRKSPFETKKTKPETPSSNVNIDLSSMSPHNSPFLTEGNPIKIEASVNSSFQGLTTEISENPLQNFQYFTNPFENVTSSGSGVPIVNSANPIPVSHDSNPQPTSPKSPVVSVLSPTSTPDSLLSSLGNLSIQSSQPKPQICVSPALQYRIPPGSFSPYSGASNFLWQKPVFPDIEYMRRNPAPEYFIIRAPTSNYPLNFSVPPPAESFTIVNSNNLSKPINATEQKKDETASLIIKKPSYESEWQPAPCFVPEPSPAGNFHVQPVNLIYYRPN